MALRPFLRGFIDYGDIGKQCVLCVTAFSDGCKNSTIRSDMGNVSVSFIDYTKFKCTGVRLLLQLQRVGKTLQSILFTQIVDGIKGGV